MKDDPYSRDERAADATNLLEDKTLREAFAELRKRYYAELMAAQVGTLTASTAHAKLLVVEDIRGQLQIFINDAKVARKR